MSGTDTTARWPRLNPANSSWDLIWTHVHRVLVVNLGVAATNLPLLVALQRDHRPWHHPVVFAVLALGTGPSLAAAFGYLRLADEEDRPPAAAFARAYTRLLRRALTLWTPLVLLAGMAAADAVFLSHRAPGPALALVPLQAVVAPAAAGCGLVAMAFAADDAGAAVPRTLLAAAYAMLRRPVLAVTNLVLAAAGLAAVNQAPLYGLAVVPGCVLYVVWRNCRALSAVVGAAAGGSLAGIRPGRRERRRPGCTARTGDAGSGRRAALARPRPGCRPGSPAHRRWARSCAGAARRREPDA